jgi:hypothetical protein
MFFCDNNTMCFFDRGPPPKLGSYQKSVKADPAGVGFKCFLKINPVGFIFKKLI